MDHHKVLVRRGFRAIMGAISPFGPRAEGTVPFVRNQAPNKPMHSQSAPRVQAHYIGQQSAYLTYGSYESPQPEPAYFIDENQPYGGYNHSSDSWEGEDQDWEHRNEPTYTLDTYQPNWEEEAQYATCCESERPYGEEHQQQEYSNTIPPPEAYAPNVPEQREQTNCNLESFEVQPETCQQLQAPSVEHPIISEQFYWCEQSINANIAGSSNEPIQSLQFPTTQIRRTRVDPDFDPYALPPISKKGFGVDTQEEIRQLDQQVRARGWKKVQAPANAQCMTIVENPPKPPIPKPRMNKSTTSTNTTQPKLSGDKVQTYMFSTAETQYQTTSTYAPIVRATAINPENPELRVDTHVLLDTGASRTLISADLANQLQLKPRGFMNIEFGTISGAETKRYGITNLFLKNIDEPKVDGKETVLPMEVMVNNDMPLDNRMADPREKEVRTHILLGQDYFWKVVCNEPWSTLDNGLQKWNTYLGSVYCGITDRFAAKDPKVSFLVMSIEDNREEEFWALDCIGITDNIMDRKDGNAIDNLQKRFLETVQYVDGDIYVQFPWIEDEPIIDDNFALALSRLAGQLNNLRNKPDLLEKYDNEFRTQLEKGIIEPAPVVQTGKTRFYIPHQMVIKLSSSTTKHRVVLDASASKKGEKSLNAVLHRGQPIIPDLVGVLLRTRTNTILVVSDVEKAFHQVKLQESERDATRILWVKDPSKPPIKANLLIFRYTRVPFGVKPSPYLLGMSILYGMTKNEDPETVKEVEDQMYVDNLFLGGENVPEVAGKCEKFKGAFGKLNMNLREFASNCPEVNNLIPKHDLVEDMDTLKLLGVDWETTHDRLGIQITLEMDDTYTKRSLLRVLAANFDPLGFAIPILIEPKVFHQSLWKKSYKWDTKLEPEDVQRWET